MMIPKLCQYSFDVFLAQLHPDRQCQEHVWSPFARVYIQVQDSQVLLLHIQSSPKVLDIWEITTYCADKYCDK
ncbi:hypothetical protein T10_9586 [Trichinella papuae]|uniref:Uncharacterized protein n=1 Tax=Trichinella papuae TaxID=268474 RepID=A0A0V1M3E5_9BILA|nr:hypothetical protein T10_9586 [Trichinella papuae]